MGTLVGVGVNKTFDTKEVEELKSKIEKLEQTIESLTDENKILENKVKELTEKSEKEALKGKKAE